MYGLKSSSTSESGVANAMLKPTKEGETNVRNDDDPGYLCIGGLSLIKHATVHFSRDILSSEIPFHCDKRIELT